MFCEHCGKELTDEAIVCPNCGCATDNYTAKNSGTATDGHTTTKVFMILGCVLTSLFGFLLPLAWTLPMTISYFNRMKEGLPIGTGFKVCTLLFVSFIAGILMLCEDDIKK